MTSRRGAMKATVAGRSGGRMHNLYPEREIVSINVDAVGESGGGIHCSTQQQPLIGA
jgi:agmatine/peptidylarginine deiminase